MSRAWASSTIQEPVTCTSFTSHTEENHVTQPSNTSDQVSETENPPSVVPPPQYVNHGIYSINVRIQQPITEKPVRHTLGVDNVSYSVKEWQGSWWKGCCLRPRQEKEVLKDVTAHMQSGQLTAVLGNSGSGKTSLLELISCRLHGLGKIEGTVKLDDEKLTQDVFRQKAGYVIQADRLMANLTVRESLTFTALLQAAGEGRGYGSHTNDRVQQVLSDLGLRHVEHALVGGHITRGISGGERRRVSIGVQLLQDPHLLLLDEPTTGLDSFTAHDLVATLSDLAKRRNKIILMTIHQPRSDIFTIFDQIGILSQGQVIYFGPREQLVPYFTNLEYSCPTYANPLDHYVDLASIDRRDAMVESECKDRLSHLRNSYLGSDICLNIKLSIETSITPPTVVPKGIDDNTKADRASQGCRTFWNILMILLHRMFLNLWRDRAGFIMRFIQTPIFAGFVWICLWRLDNGIQTAVQDRSGIIYQTLSVPSMVGVLCGVALFPCIRDLYFRESREGQYGCHHVLIAYYIHIMPFTLLSTLGYSVWLFWGVGLSSDASRFAIVWGVASVQQYLGEVMTVACLGIFHGAPLAQATCTILVNAFLLLASGFLRSVDRMLNILQWIGHALHFKWASQILNANEFHGLHFDCEEDNQLACVVFTGDTYLNSMFPGAVDNLNRNIGILVAYIGALWVVVILLYRVRGIKHLH